MTMEQEDFRKLLIAAGISAGMTPHDAIATAEQTLEMYSVIYQDASNDD